ncbi:mitochondrial F1-F0 ATP synthase subunit F of fungi-domain-containing protein [Neohortaea acidophila]|uniref:Mitochondrial F1-F0 ATP synthase subunit F of fungi-domain-containing protein n=1 Tax=Neohortaea acidophila TaxID=245834 RepID=A0A6A6Q6Z5_9PEZI|nr:mitochondrial F1-F0 ATP synthase subunit F of fungi-domain-containing protein [Neohortaea acidophila]KAF2488218.1 mitochondrial F1-F0 ATP synthase subunit F of fungi-domain-containing protein [Neohortaea acidophila]
MVSSLVPPKVSRAIGGAADAARMERVISFYEKLPRGSAPEAKPRGLLQWYQHKYMGKNPRAMPLVHLIGGLALLGYAQNYYFHLRHHKNNAH